MFFLSACLCVHLGAYLWNFVCLCISGFLCVPVCVRLCMVVLLCAFVNLEDECVIVCAPCGSVWGGLFVRTLGVAVRRQIFMHDMALHYTRPQSSPPTSLSLSLSISCLHIAIVIFNIRPRYEKLQVASFPARLNCSLGMFIIPTSQLSPPRYVSGGQAWHDIKVKGIQ